MAIWPRAALAAAGLALLGACRTPAPVVPGDAQAGRRTIAALGEPGAVHLQGLIELHWSDESGRHLEQGDLEAWVRGRTHASARVTKFGDVYIWVGSTPEGDFAFDLASDPTTLTRSGHDARHGAVLHPASLRRLLGIDGMPADAVSSSLDDAVSVDFDRPDGSHETVRLSADGGRVLQVEITPVKGSPITAEHRGHEDGLVFAGRAFARYVDVRSGDDLARIRIALIEAPADVPDAVFDVERLTGALRPDRVRSGEAP